MISKEGVIWCWKNNSDNTLFIFRENNVEIEVHFNKSYELLTFTSDTQLTEVEKEFMVNLKRELNGK